MSIITQLRTLALPWTCRHLRPWSCYCRYPRQRSDRCSVACSDILTMQQAEEKKEYV